MNMKRTDMKNAHYLIAYFSHSGNTRIIAEQIYRNAGGTLFEIVPADPYPADYDAVVDQARGELERKYLPELKTRVTAWETYPLVFVGYPNWWSTVPRPVAAFLSGYDFSGKTVAPFCTHGGGGMGRSIADIRDLCPQATVLDGLAVPGGSTDDAQDAVAGWLRNIGITEKK